MKNFFITILILALLGIIGFGGYYIFNLNTEIILKISNIELKIDNLNEQINEVKNKNEKVNAEITNNNSNIEEQVENRSFAITSTKTASYFIDGNENKIDATWLYGLSFIENDFENFKNVSDEELLNALAKVLLAGIIEIDGKTVQAGDRFTLEEISGLTEYVFGKKIEKEITTDGLKYINGKFQLENIDNNVKCNIYNLAVDGAAGSIYYTYEVDYESNNKSKKFEIRYNNTNQCIQSKKTLEF